ATTRSGFWRAKAPSHLGSCPCAMSTNETPLNRRSSRQHQAPTNPPSMTTAPERRQGRERCRVPLQAQGIEEERVEELPSQAIGRVNRVHPPRAAREGADPLVGHRRRPAAEEGHVESIALGQRRAQLHYERLGAAPDDSHPGHDEGDFHAVTGTRKKSRNGPWNRQKYTPATTAPATTEAPRRGHDAAGKSQATPRNRGSGSR